MLALAVEVQYFIQYKYTLEYLSCHLWLIFSRTKEKDDTSSSIPGSV